MAYIGDTMAFATAVPSPAPEPAWMTPICVTVSRSSAGGTVMDAERPEFISLFRKLYEFADLPRNWDSYGAAPPNEIALDAAQTALRVLMDFNLIPEAVVPSADGGVGFVFRRGAMYGDVECRNDKHVLAVVSDGRGQPQAWEVEPNYIGFEHAIRRIRTHLGR